MQTVDILTLRFTMAKKKSYLHIPGISEDDVMDFLSKLDDKDRDMLFDGMDKLSKLIDSMSDEERSLLDDMVQQDVEGEESMDAVREFNKKHYRYHKPDYKAMSTNGSKVPARLKPFWQLEQGDQVEPVCRKVLKSYKDKGQIPEDVRNYLLCLFTDFDADSYLHASVWRLYAPLWLLDQYFFAKRSAEDYERSLKLVLEVLRQDGMFYTIFIATHQEYICAVLTQIGMGHIGMLNDFLYEKNLFPVVSEVAFDAMATIAYICPERRMEIVALLLAFLNHEHKRMRDGGMSYSIPHYAYTLATAHFTEALPTIDGIFTDEELFYTEEELEYVHSIMNDRSVPFRFKYFNIAEVVGNNEVARRDEEHNNTDLNDGFPTMEEDDEDEEDWDDDDFDDEEDEWDEDEEDEYNDRELYRFFEEQELPENRYRLGLVLEDAPARVDRSIEVPSNIYLNNFADVILLSLGLQDVSGDAASWYFSQGQKRYYNEDSFEEHDMENVKGCFNSREFTLGRILKTRNQSITFVYDYESGKAWRFTLRMKSIGFYDPVDDRLVVSGGHGSFLACLRGKADSKQKPQQIDSQLKACQRRLNEYEYDL